MTRFERILLAVGALGTFVTGAVFAWMKYLMTTDDPYAVVNHPLQPLALKLHILLAPVLVFAIGLVFTQHIWKRWRSGRPSGRRSGAITLLTVVPMVLSGYLIQTITGGAVLGWMIVIHLVTGTVYVVMYAVHRVRMRARARRRLAESSARPVGVPDDSEDAA